MLVTALNEAIREYQKFAGHQSRRGARLRREIHRRLRSMFFDLMFPIRLWRTTTGVFRATKFSFLNRFHGVAQTFEENKFPVA